MARENERLFGRLPKGLSCGIFYRAAYLGCRVGDVHFIYIRFQLSYLSRLSL